MASVESARRMTATLRAQQNLFLNTFATVVKFAVDDAPSVLKEGDGSSLLAALDDGTLLCKLVSAWVPGVLDMRAVSTAESLSDEAARSNCSLALFTARSAGLPLGAVGVDDLRPVKPSFVLDLLWQLFKHHLLGPLDMKRNPKLAGLHGDEEELVAVPPEKLLMRWLNYQLSASGCDSRLVSNVVEDLRDGEVLLRVLSAIAPDELGDVDAALAGSAEERLAAAMGAADRLGAALNLQPAHALQEDGRFLLALAARLFALRPCLGDIALAELPSGRAMDTREEEYGRQEGVFRRWINSLSLAEVSIVDLFADLRSGVVMLKLIDLLRPGLVAWERVNQLRSNRFQLLENCNYVVKLCGELRFSLVNIGGIDILDSNKKIVLSLVWQLMRLHAMSGITMRLNRSRSRSAARSGGARERKKSLAEEADVLSWAQTMVKEHGTGNFGSIHSFHDPTIADALFLLDLLHAMDSEAVNWDIVELGESEAEHLSNARYALSVAAKVGATVFATPEDIVHVRGKMLLTLFAALHAAHLLREERRRIMEAARLSAVAEEDSEEDDSGSDDDDDDDDGDDDDAMEKKADDVDDAAAGAAGAAAASSKAAAVVERPALRYTEPLYEETVSHPAASGYAMEFGDSGIAADAALQSPVFFSYQFTRLLAEEVDEPRVLTVPLPSPALRTLDLVYMHGWLTDEQRQPLYAALWRGELLLFFPSQQACSAFFSDSASRLTPCGLIDLETATGVAASTDGGSLQLLLCGQETALSFQAAAGTQFAWLATLRACLRPRLVHLAEQCGGEGVWQALDSGRLPEAAAMSDALTHALQLLGCRWTAWQLTDEQQQQLLALRVAADGAFSHVDDLDISAALPLAADAASSGRQFVCLEAALLPVPVASLRMPEELTFSGVLTVAHNDGTPQQLLLSLWRTNVLFGFDDQLLAASFFYGERSSNRCVLAVNLDGVVACERQLAGGRDESKSDEGAGAEKEETLDAVVLTSLDSTFLFTGDATALYSFWLAVHEGVAARCADLAEACGDDALEEARWGDLHADTRHFASLLDGSLMGDALLTGEDAARLQSLRAEGYAFTQPSDITGVPAFFTLNSAGVRDAGCLPARPSEMFYWTLGRPADAAAVLQPAYDGGASVLPSSASTLASETSDALFAQTSVLQTALLLDTVEAAAVMKAFKTAAQAAGGELAKEQFHTCLLDLVGDTLGDDKERMAEWRVHADRLFALFDSDGNGTVDFNELASGLSLLCGGSADDKLHTMFYLIDEDGDGTLSREEMFVYLKSLFRVLCMSAPDAVAGGDFELLARSTTDKCFEDCDVDDSGTLTLDEFQMWYMGDTTEAAGAEAAGAEAASVEAASVEAASVEAASAEGAVAAAPSAVGSRRTEARSLEELRRDCGLSDVHIDDVLAAMKEAVLSSESAALDVDDFVAAVGLCSQQAEGEDGAAARLHSAAEELFAMFDSDGNGALDVNEIATGVSLLCGGSAEEKVNCLFALYDTDGNGAISVEEMRNYLTAVFRVVLGESPGVPAEDLASITTDACFSEADVDGDGQLSLEEFMAWYEAGGTAALVPSAPGAVV